MIRNWILIATVALAATTACKTDDEATADQPEPAAQQPAETSGAPQAPEQPESAPTETTDENEPRPGTFGGLVDGAVMVSITQRQPDGDADYGGAERVADDDWIAAFVKAIDPDTPGSEAVPKCLPNYTLVFSDADGEMATFGGVCAGKETVVLVRDGAAYSADDDATARKLLRELATASEE